MSDIFIVVEGKIESEYRCPFDWNVGSRMSLFWIYYFWCLIYPQEIYQKGEAYVCKFSNEGKK